jgi:hypothetical protein
MCIEPGLFTHALALLLDIVYTRNVPLTGIHTGIPFGRKFPYANKSLPDRRGDS